MSATARWQDVIAENLSVSAVPGGRKQELSFSDVQAGLAANTNDPAKPGYYIPTAKEVTNFTAGELKSTGNPMDFALEGPGFFTVQLAGGQQGYTRDGEFQINSKGQLVTKEGYPVLSNGGPLQFNPNSGAAITISATGQVSQGEQTIGKLQTVEFKDPSQLIKRGAGFFSTDSTKNPATPSTTTQIRQGFIESANSSPTTEMASMITAMRMFEANQKVLQMQGDRMSKVITELGDTSQS